MEFIIDQVLSDNSGQYVCDAINNFGGQRNELTVKVVSAPKVVINPSQLSLAENSRKVLKCAVENRANDGKCLISWIIDGKMHENVRKVRIVVIKDILKFSFFRKMLQILNSSQHDIITTK